MASHYSSLCIAVTLMVIFVVRLTAVPSNLGISTATCYFHYGSSEFRFGGSYT